MIKLDNRPWFLQVNYLLVVICLVALEPLKSFGLVRVLGGMLVLLALFMQLSPQTSLTRIKIPCELRLYTLWGLWSLVTGFFVAKVPFLFWYNEKILFQMILLLWSMFAIFVRQRQLSYYFYILLIVALIQVVATRMGFQLDKGANEIVRDVILDETTMRASGLTGNANGMGFAMLSGVWACIMLWRTNWGKFRVFVWPLLLCGMVLFSYFTIQTASRKSLLVLGLLFAGWAMWMLPGKLSVVSVVCAFMMGIVAVVIGMAVTRYVMNDTFMGVRLQQWLDAGGGNAVAGFEQNIRYALYVDGFKLWLHHPIAGIGLGNFNAWHWSGLYSHSDYIEPLACTGLVGFILYHGFAFIVTLRIVRLLRKQLPPIESYNLKGMLLLIICDYYLIGIGCPHWSSPGDMVAIIFCGTYAWRIQKEFIEHRYVYGR